MPLYEYRCPICADTFEARRPMAEASDPIECPQGHDGARRKLSVFASVGTSSTGSADAAPTPRSSGHGCGGGMCGC
jgi:putative FmdB family regulatory protein